MQVFFKSAFITFICLLLIFLLAAGFIVVDNRYSAAMGNKPKSYLDIDNNSNIINVSVFGRQFQIDVSYINKTTDKINEIKPVIPPEIRLIYSSIKELYEKIEEGIQEWIK